MSERVQISLKLDPVRDADIIAYLQGDGVRKQTAIKYMIRQYLYEREETYDAIKVRRKSKAAKAAG